jgi:hypothetical protein
VKFSLTFKRMFFTIKFKHIIPYIVFTAIVVLFSVFLFVIDPWSRDSVRLIIYTFSFSIGTLIFIHFMLFNVEIKRTVKIIYCILTPFYNYLLMLILYVYYEFFHNYYAYYLGRLYKWILSIM